MGYLMKIFRLKKGFVIPAVLTIIGIVAIFSIFATNFSKNQDAKTFHIVNLEKARLLAESAIEAGTYKIRNEMNNMGNLNPVDIVKGIVTMLSNPAASWYLKMRVPGIVVSGGVGSSTGIPGVNAEINLSPDTLGLSPTWSKQSLDKQALGLTQFIKELSGDESRSKVELTMMIKDMKPVVSDKGSVLWPGAVIDDSFLKDWLKKLGTQLFDFLGISSIKFEIDFAKYIKDFTINIYGIPIPVGKIFSEALGKFLVIKIDVGAMLTKALESIVSQLKIGDILPIKADIVIEKLATLTYSCRVEFVPSGTSTPVVTEVEASRDVKVVDLAAPNPLYSFYWMNKDNKTFTDKEWGETKGGVFKVMNLNLDPDYKCSFDVINDTIKFFKGLFSMQIVRFPGLCYIGGAGKQKIPTGLNDLLLIYPAHFPPLTMISNPSTGGPCYLPSWYFRGIPVDGMPIWIPYCPAPPFGVAMIIKLACLLSGNKGTPNTQLFGEWCLSPPINFKISGNVVKTYTKITGFAVTITWPIPPIIWSFYGLRYKSEEAGYSYSFFEQEPKAETKGMIENIYTPDQYRKKASLVYKDGVEFNKDSSVVDSNKNIKIDGVIYIGGDAAISGKFMGAGQLVVNGNLTVDGDIIHFPKDGDRIIPFSIICMKKLTIASNCRIMAPVYAKEGVATKDNKKGNIIGNFVCEDFNPNDLTGDFSIWYTPEISTCSFLSLIPYVGRYMPDRYRVVLSNQFSTYKINRVQ